jgi:hypothetical protein
MWLSDLLHAQSAIRPTRPTKKKHVGRHESLMYVGPPDTPDMPDTKKAPDTPPRARGMEHTTFTQVLYENPESARHLTTWEAHWRSVCADYPTQCSSCPDGDMAKRVFCRRHPRPEWAGNIPSDHGTAPRPAAPGCSKRRRGECEGYPGHCRPGCVFAVQYHTAADGRRYFIRTIMAETRKLQ